MNRISQKALRQEGSFLSWRLFSVAGLISWIAGLDLAAPWLPFLLSIGLVGLPHGAADWLLLQPASKRDALRKFLSYTLAGLAVAIIAWLSPVTAIVGFFLLTILHFGMGDERDLRSFEPGQPNPPLARGSGIFRIAIFFALVCLTHPESVVSLFNCVGKLLGEAGGSVFTAASLEAVSLPLLILAVSGWTISLFIQARERLRESSFRLRKGRFEIEVTEGAVLILAAICLDAVFAVGLYFLSWHALRHSYLLAGRLSGPTGKSQILRRNLAVLHLRSWPLLLPVIPVMIGLIWVNGSFISPNDWVAALLVICIVFTLPHHCIVERQLNGIGKKVTRSAGRSIPSAGTEIPLSRSS